LRKHSRQCVQYIEKLQSRKRLVAAILKLGKRHFVPFCANWTLRGPRKKLVLIAKLTASCCRLLVAQGLDGIAVSGLPRFAKHEVD
jgi:hypothetical protein